MKSVMLTLAVLSGLVAWTMSGDGSTALGPSQSLARGPGGGSFGGRPGGGSFGGQMGGGYLGGQPGVGQFGGRPGSGSFGGRPGGGYLGGLHPHWPPYRHYYPHHHPHHYPRDISGVEVISVEPTVVETGSFVGPTSSSIVANPVPANITIVNPRENTVALGFTLDGESYSLEPGYQQKVYRACVIEFDRGGVAGIARYTISQGTYAFRLVGSSWDLFACNSQNPTPQVSDLASVPEPAP